MSDEPVKAPLWREDVDEDLDKVKLLLIFYGGAGITLVLPRKTAQEWVRQFGTGEWAPKKSEEYDPENEDGMVGELTLLYDDDGNPGTAYRKTMVVAVTIVE